jgi:hypothetical protein
MPSDPQQAVDYDAIAQQSGALATPAPPAQLHGDDYLATLPPTMAAQIKGISEGRVPFPPQMIRSGPMGMYNQMLTQAALQYDPSLDASTGPKRLAYAANFAKQAGPQGNLTALNTVIPHLARLSQAGDALKNFNGPAGLANAPINAVESALGDPRLGNYQTLVNNLFSPEMTKMLRQSAGSEADIQGWQKSFGGGSGGITPDQLHGKIGEIANAIQDRVNGITSERDNIMGPNGARLQVLSPQNQALLDTLAAKGTAATRQPLTKPPQAPPGYQYVAKPDGTGFTAVPVQQAQ